MVPKRVRDASLPAALLLAAVALSLLLVQPPSPLAAADRLFEAVAFRLFAPPQPQSSEIVIVAIAEETLARLPYRSPIDRDLLARTVNALSAAGARAIGLDILFDQATEPAKDRALRAALQDAAPPVVVISALGESPLSPESRRYLAAFLGGLRTGYANLARDRFDGSIREHIPADPATGESSFPAALARAIGVPVPERPFPVTWRKRPADALPFAMYPADAVPHLPASWLAGKIALIGSLLPGIDEHRTPVAAFGQPTYGVEIHAHVLAQLLDGRAAAPALPPWTMIAATAVLAGTGMALAHALAGWGMIAAVAGTAAAFWALALGAYAMGGPLVPLVAPILGLALASGGMRFWRGRGERRDRQVLRQLFSRFVSEPVVAEILREREMFLAGNRPRPHELTATVLFSDIAGFTSVCERLEPAPLIAWLDRYIDTMVQLVMTHDGVVLRFIGDGILAVFGAPIPRSSETEIDTDARNAAQCALAMAVAMRRLNEEWRAAGLPEAGLRVGIHTGPLVAGSLGNGPHMEYCLLGDTANVAARLEALGKTHAAGGPGDCVILAGEPTWRRLGGATPAQPVGEVSLRGKQQKVAVYRLDGGHKRQRRAVANVQLGE